MACITSNAISRLQVLGGIIHFVIIPLQPVVLVGRDEMDTSMFDPPDFVGLASNLMESLALE
jgi:hypothetical protein